MMEYMRKLVPSEVLSQSKGKVEGIKILKLTIFAVAVFGLGVFASPKKAGAAIRFYEDFESASIDTNKWVYSINGSDWSIDTVNAPKKSGNRSAKFYIRRVDSESYRVELTPKSFSGFGLNNDYWFGFSLYLPEDWIDDIEGETVFQIHSNPDLSLGEEWRSPPLQLQFDEDLNKWSWFNIWDPKKVTIGNDPRPEGGWGSSWSGDLPKGQWIDWVLHYKPDYSSGGILEIWKDGQQVVNKKGPNAYNDSWFFVKAGIYKSKWKFMQTNVNTRVLYLDEIRIGDGSSSYTEVAPGPRTYYAAPLNHNPAPVSSGNCTSANPCTPNYAINTMAAAGDTVLLKDGTYTGADYMIAPIKSGTVGKLIAIKAENDGMAIVDGENVRKTLVINTRSYIIIEGIQFKNVPESIDNNPAYTGEITNSSNVTIRRCSFHDPVQSTSNFTTLLVYACRPNDYSGAVIVEDSVITGKMAMMNLQGSNYVIIRRNYFRGSYAGVYGYNASYFIEENNIITMPESSGCDACYPNNGPKINTGTVADHNKIIGNIALGNAVGDTHYGGFGVFSNEPHNMMNNNDFMHNVAINVENTGIRIDTDATGSDIQNNTLVWDNNDTDFSGINFQNLNTTIATVRNNSFVGNGSGYGIYRTGGTIANSFNNYYNLAYPRYGGLNEANEYKIDPSYLKVTYGYGAYLMIPPTLKEQGENKADIGAEVLYRYEKGVLTNEPLWQNDNDDDGIYEDGWPMEARICSETGYSVTYDHAYTTPSGTPCPKGGGIWKTLDKVYDNPADVNGDEQVNIKDIQICVKAIVDPETISEEHLNNCKKVAPPDATTNIKDIQVIIREIIVGS